MQSKFGERDWRPTGAAGGRPQGERGGEGKAEQGTEGAAFSRSQRPRQRPRQRLEHPRPSSPSIGGKRWSAIPRHYRGSGSRSHPSSGGPRPCPCGTRATPESASRSEQPRLGIARRHGATRPVRRGGASGAKRNRRDREICACMAQGPHKSGDEDLQRQHRVMTSPSSAFFLPRISIATRLERTCTRECQEEDLGSLSRRPSA